jgi:hypothetical protein
MVPSRHTCQPGGGRKIRLDIMKGTAIAVSDGSFKATKGAAAWVIVGAPCIGKLSGCTMVPGEASDQSSYCSKLTGLLAIVYMAHAICQCYTIQEGTITIGCDNMSALDMAYGPDNVSSSSADYDILIAIRKTIKKCAITWLPHQISGDINWKALHTALEESPQYTEWFITNHTTGMCGVGKFMLRWKERDTNSCPHCGEREDAKHVWHCPSRSNLQIWSKELENLQEWLQEKLTNPSIISAIILGLSNWLHIPSDHPTHDDT